MNIRNTTIQQYIMNDNLHITAIWQKDNDRICWIFFFEFVIIIVITHQSLISFVTIVIHDEGFTG